MFFPYQRTAHLRNRVANIISPQISSNGTRPSLIPHTCTTTSPHTTYPHTSSCIPSSPSDTTPIYSTSQSTLTIPLPVTHSNPLRRRKPSIRTRILYPPSLLLFFAPPSLLFRTISVPPSIENPQRLEATVPALVVCFAGSADSGNRNTIRGCDGIGVCG